MATVTSPTSLAPADTSNNGKATAALILGLLCFVAPFFASVPAIVLGVLGLRESNELGGVGKGRAIFGIVMGSIVSVLWVGVILMLVTN